MLPAGTIDTHHMRLQLMGLSSGETFENLRAKLFRDCMGRWLSDRAVIMEKGHVTRRMVMSQWEKQTHGWVIEGLQ